MADRLDGMWGFDTQGRRAFKQGKHESDCPHPDGDIRHNVWINGYRMESAGYSQPRSNP